MKFYTNLLEVGAAQRIGKLSGKQWISEAHKFLMKYIQNNKNVNGPQRVAVKSSVLSVWEIKPWVKFHFCRYNNVHNVM